MRYGYIPAPETIYRNIYKLLPGTLLSLSGRDRELPAPVAYWSARQAAEAGLTDPFTGTDAEACDYLDNVLRRAITQQMVSDVPLGAFLSGGVDSSTVVALMQAQSAKPVRTFTIGFAEADYNEAPFSRAVAQYLRTDHTELYVTPTEAQAVIPRLPAIYDEPFADASQIPTFLVSQLAARHVTVSLSGDGGDELFAGYGWYRRASRIWNKVGWAPPRARRMFARTLEGIPVAGWDGLFAGLRPLIPRGWRRDLNGDRVHKFAELIGRVTNVESVHEGLVSSRWSLGKPVLGATTVFNAEDKEDDWNQATDPIQRLMYRDLLRYLPDNILTKVDRASMGVSLESRAPFLDHRVVEFAWRVPFAKISRGGQGKWLLRQLLYRYLPAPLIDRPKKGFCVPIDSWLRGPLHDWAADLLSEERLRRQGFFDPQLVEQKWREHKSGRRNWQQHLWSTLMFQVWLESQ
jgi:asparagine synthase (glutamine-hydrolysing)